MSSRAVTLESLEAYDVYDVIPLSEVAKRKPGPQNIVGGIALSAIALACAVTLYTNAFGPAVEPVARFADAAPASRNVPDFSPSVPAVSGPRALSLLDPAPVNSPRDAAGRAPLRKGDRLAVSTPKSDRLTVVAAAPAEPAKLDDPLVQPPSMQQLVASIPLPTPRPTVLQMPDTPPVRPAPQQVAKAAQPITPPSEKAASIFEKLFGKFERNGPMLAFAPSDGGVTSDGSSATPGGMYDRSTAVYDISARTVYMPDGSKLEAHSGLGAQLDDPRFVHVKMRGATPPHTYDLTLRESLFHGVEAIRLTPVGGAEAIHGRTGLLAHTYMLGPNGDSNGCVSFRNYEAFLRAYKQQRVKRLVVVAKL